MSRKPPSISYDALTIGPSPGKSAPAKQPPQTPTETSRRPGRTTMREEAAPVTLYLHPDARKALKRYAFEQEVKVHDLLLEAVEEWFRSHGLREQVRVTRTGLDE
jgi:hypothetical protein